MAKEEITTGDVIRLKRNMSFGTVHLRANRTGTVKKVTKKFFGDTEYVVRFSGTTFDITITGRKHIDLAQVADGGVYKD